ncbi:MAG: glycine cleavage system aminomethyltransferase GcvT [Bdellovibrionales bacterium]|nr:glycine cleavage system aminomethyltransferase GcvT [Bdellovibrionales bacterium]
MLKRTPLFEEHKKLGGKMVDFGGWELPVQYSGLTQEHEAVRNHCGIFDVSHMGEFRVQGPGALGFVNFATTNDASTLAVFQAQYSALCNSHGGIVDDLVVYRLGEQEFLLVVNAANIEKDFHHLSAALSHFEGPKPQLTNESEQFAQIAIQGPASSAVLQTLADMNLEEIKTYWCSVGKVCGESSLVARTGYTGEDGFEVYVTPEAAPKIWNALLTAGAHFGILPCGLGARDTLRLEMKFALYGHELTENTNPFETGLGWITKLKKNSEFIGKPAISKIKDAGPTRSLVGILSLGRGIPRQGYEVFDETRKTRVGFVTSGTQSPTLKKAIGIALIEKKCEKAGTRLWVKIREDLHEFEVCKTPFIDKKKEN